MQSSERQAGTRPRVLQRPLLGLNPTRWLNAAGVKTFEDAGGSQAYFGFPADATAEEGRQTIAVLGAILAEAVLAELAR